MNYNKIHGTVFILVVCVLAAPACAIEIYGISADMSGSRSVGAVGLFTTEPDWQDAVIEWSIVNNGDLTLTYTYTLINFDRPGISHFTLDFSDNCIGDSALTDPGCLTDVQLNGDPSNILEPGDRDGIVGAAKFDVGEDGDLTYSFISNRMPVYGDLYVKGGQSALYNTGFGQHDSQLMTAGDFIARPDSFLVAPEPTSLVLIAAGSLAMLRRRKSAA